MLVAFMLAAQAIVQQHYRHYNSGLGDGVSCVVVIVGLLFLLSDKDRAVHPIYVVK
jgi:hypothetical protein